MSWSGRLWQGISSICPSPAFFFPSLIVKAKVASLVGLVSTDCEAQDQTDVFSGGGALLDLAPSCRCLRPEARQMCIHPWRRLKTVPVREGEDAHIMLALLAGQ